MKNHHNFTSEELEIIDRYNTPEKVDYWLRKKIYHDHTGSVTVQSFRRVVRSGYADCLECALAAAAILSQYGYPPKIVCMEAPKIAHNIFIYKNGNGIRPVSNGVYLEGKEMKDYKTIKSLVMECSNFNHRLRGWTMLDLRQFDGQDWITTDEDLLFIQEKLFHIEYNALFPRNGKRKYLIPDDDGKKVIWL